MDIESLLRLLNENKVKYVIIGAFAFPFYGYTRATLDVDIFVKPEKENIERLMEALRNYGYDLQDLTIQDFLENKILIRQYTLEIDLHPYVKGVCFEEVWKNRKKVRLKDVEFYIPSLEDLVKMKESAGREKDLQDVKILKKLKS
ncbi:hypothetical protein DRQ16_04550 [bacterium]|nr:MAG: hypothetical protein DRQ16_04550 [bacterium]